MRTTGNGRMSLSSGADETCWTGGGACATATAEPAAGSCVGTGEPVIGELPPLLGTGAASTRPVGADTAVADPAPVVAVTLTFRRRPSSAARTT